MASDAVLQELSLYFSSSLSFDSYLYLSTWFIWSGSVNVVLTKWKKDATEFTVKVNYNSKRGTQIYLPKPVVDLLGEPESLKFSLKNGRISITSGD